MTPKIPLSQPDVTEAEIGEVVSVLRSARLSLGPRMEEFEGCFRARLGTQHAVAVSSGTAGLHLCLLALGIGPGDEVIVPSFAFIAAANVIRYVGATPVFVDIDAHTLNLDPHRVEDAMTSRTRALMVVHTFGYPAEMQALLALARGRGLFVIEDACEALGAIYEEQPVGTFGDAAVFAFYPNKQITTGEGGMVVTRSTELASKLRALRNQGRYEGDHWQQHSVLGYNYRLSEMSCALGCAQMARLENILARRAQVARSYLRRLGHPLLTLPAEDTLQRRRSWFVFVVQVGGACKATRDEIVAHMGASGVQCGRYFAAIHQQPLYASLVPRFTLPVTEAVSQTTIALPFFNQLGEEQIAYIADTLLARLR